VFELKKKLYLHIRWIVFITEEFRKKYFFLQAHFQKISIFGNFKTYIIFRLN